MLTTRQPTIFLLDDDPAIQDSFSLLFQVMDLPIECYSTTRDFLDAYDPSRPGCLLLDIRLPGGGFRVLEKLAESDSRLPVVVVTGHGNSEMRERATELGAAAFFEKPCDSSELCECIVQLIGQVSET